MTAAGPRSGPRSSPFVRLLASLQASGFADLRGADVSADVPISERLLNEIVQQSLPPSLPVRDLYVSPRDGDRFDVRLRVGSSSLLPPLKLALRIYRQPDLPSSPVLVFKLEMGALASLAAPALRFFDAFPRGVRLEGDLLSIDIAELLAQRGLDKYLQHVRRIELHTSNAIVVASIRAGVS
jgi:hypothetical protein